MTQSARSIPTLSLFSGAGGLDIGFEQAGFDIKAQVEIEPSYVATLRENAGKAHSPQSAADIHCQDVRAFDTRPYRKLGIECVIGGPPCQTFSAAGRRAGGVIGTEDERGQLFKAYCRILEELRPKVFVFENVYGLPGANGGRPWREIVQAFSRLGYSLRAEVIDAADYGVPQHRERLILVGYQSGTFEFPSPTHGPDAPSGKPLVSVEAAIKDLQDPEEPSHDDLGGMYGHLLPLVPEGLNYAFFTAEMGHPAPVFAWRSKFHDLLYKVRRDEPCRTIKANPGKFTGPFHWKNRHFTVAELKRLQTFPDEYILVGSFGKVLQQIGNSVPPRLAYVIAQSVRDQLLDKKARQSFRLRPAGFQSTFRQRQRERSAEFAERAEKAIKLQYGVRPTCAALPVAEARETYSLSPQDRFDRKRLPATNRKADYKIQVTEKDRHIDLLFNKRGAAEDNAFSIEIVGLSKYIPSFDTLTAAGRATSLADVFHVWAAIEDALTKRSRFFTLIDIYGHYANRGDTVKVSGQWRLDESATINRVLEWITSSMNCGAFWLDEQFRAAVALRSNQIAGVVEVLRGVRFDFRTSQTHPIIGRGRVICTYPFPLLSPRALVESRAVLSKSAQTELDFMGTLV